MSLPLISVIMIGRNESRHIARCVKSAIQATEKFVEAELVYVDSASDDETVDIASQFPIRILQLRPEWTLSAAAGRYIGFHNTQGEYVMFVDGDSTLNANWLEKAIVFLQQDAQVGGVAGIVDEAVHDQMGHQVDLRTNRYGQQGSQVEVPTLGGIALYRRSALDASGPFNPYITVDEERELALRLRKKGYRLIRLNIPMAVTCGPLRDTVREILRRLSSRHYNFGVTLRYCAANGLFWQYLTERLGFLISFCAVVLISFVAVIVAYVTGNLWVLFASAVALSLLVTGAAMLQRTSCHKLLLSVLKRAIMSYRTLVTFVWTRPKPINSYPKDAILVQ